MSRGRGPDPQLLCPAHGPLMACLWSTDSISHARLPGSRRNIRPQERVHNGREQRLLGSRQRCAGSPAHDDRTSAREGKFFVAGNRLCGNDVRPQCERLPWVCAKRMGEGDDAFGRDIGFIPRSSRPFDERDISLAHGYKRGSAPCHFLLRDMWQMFPSLAGKPLAKRYFFFSHWD